MAVLNVTLIILKTFIFTAGDFLKRLITVEGFRNCVPGSYMFCYHPLLSIYFCSSPSTDMFNCNVSNLQNKTLGHYVHAPISLNAHLHIIYTFVRLA